MPTLFLCPHQACGRPHLLGAGRCLLLPCLRSVVLHHFFWQAGNSHEYHHHHWSSPPQRNAQLLKMNPRSFDAGSAVVVVGFAAASSVQSVCAAC